MVIINTRWQQEAGGGSHPPDRSSALEQTFCRGEFVKTPLVLDTLQSSSRHPVVNSEQQGRLGGKNLPQFLENYQLK